MHVAFVENAAIEAILDIPDERVGERPYRALEFPGPDSASHLIAVFAECYELIGNLLGPIPPDVVMFECLVIE